MKIAVSSSSDAGLDSSVDPQFGRCPFYTIIEIEDGEITNVQSLSNTAGEASFFNVGVQAIQQIINCNVNTVITGKLGPKSFRGLRDAGIPAYSVTPEIQVSEALEMFLQNKLSLISEEGVPHMGRYRRMRK